MSSQAVYRVYSTFELLEDILLRLPTRQILVLQRVCRLWKTTIENSNRIQQELFFQPAAKDYDKNSEIKVNPLIIEKFNVHWGNRNRADGLWNNNVDSKRVLIRNYIVDEWEWQCKPLAYYPNRLYARAPESRAFTYRDASWRRMLVSRPPETNAKLTEIHSWDGDFWIEPRVTAFSVGKPIRMGDVFQDQATARQNLKSLARFVDTIVARDLSNLGPTFSFKDFHRQFDVVEQYRKHNPSKKPLVFKIDESKLLVTVKGWERWTGMPSPSDLLRIG